MGARWPLGMIACLATLLLFVTRVSQAQQRTTEAPTVGAIPRIAPAPEFTAFAGRRIVRIEVTIEGTRWREPVRLTRVRLGEALTPEVARRAMRELLDTAKFATVTAHAENIGPDVSLIIRALPRRVVASVRLIGNVLDEDRALEAAGIRRDGEVTAPSLAAAVQRLRDYYAHRGYPGAYVRVDALDTDDAMRVVIVIDITPGPSARVERLVFVVRPSPDVPGLRDAVSAYPVSRGDRIDEELLQQGDRDLEKRLRTRGWHRATVAHEAALSARAGVQVRVLVNAGPLLQLRFEGNQQFDAARLEAALELEENEDRTPASLADRLRELYERHGFLDAEVRVEERGAESAKIHDLVFVIRENRRVRVVAREYPCLTGHRNAAEVGSELDSFLSEELPGGELFSAVDPRVVDATFGPRQTTGARVAPSESNPWLTYVPDVYERAMKHVQDLYRSEGYLSATVGPVQLLRRRCHVRSPPGGCIPIGARQRPSTTCLYDEVGMPLEEPPPDTALSCVADRARGVQCEPNAILHIPIKLGPRTYLYDVAFEGNRLFVENALEEVAELELGQPVSQATLENATRRVLDAYAEEGFAFASVETLIEFSPDRTRARVRFVISEREQVRVAGIIVRGARQTREGLIRGRVALEVGELYRQSDVRKTEERLATLGVFSSVTVGLDDPYVPSRAKYVVITVVERKPQYLDVRPGFSTGEGFRITFEYGHRNLAGEAIQLTLRVQLGYLPDPLILEEDVRRKISELDGDERLERRNTATLEFPEIGLGPLFRLSLEGVDVHDIARDFWITKDAGIVTLSYRPERRVTIQVGGSLERNDSLIFGGDSEERGVFFSLFRVPQGLSVAVAQRLGFTLDRRDNPLEATSGTYTSFGIEHVRAVYSEEDRVGQFLHNTATVAGYVRLNASGLAIATSLGIGFNDQLRDNSTTYPDRLFFMGGIDSIRGFLQDSLVPEDVAQQIFDGVLTPEQVAIRGGDVSLNPRAELRIPLGETTRTAVFVDAGNLWADARRVEPFKLRYAVGTGLRFATPIGPLVFDYGFNVQRVLDRLGITRGATRRYWEDLGAFHFSVGLF